MSATGRASKQRSPEEDPRYQRTRAALVHAVVELARTTPADKITVSELTARAGVARQTFYKHASTPADLLANYLIDQLQPDFADLATLLSSVTQDPRQRLTDVYVRMMSTISQQPEIYHKIFATNAPSVRAASGRSFQPVCDRFCATPGMERVATVDRNGCFPAASQHDGDDYGVAAHRNDGERSGSGRHVSDACTAVAAGAFLGKWESAHAASRIHRRNGVES